MYNFTEQQIEAIGGLHESDRRYPEDQLNALVPLAGASCRRFSEALKQGRGIKQWWKAAQEASSKLREANSETALGFLVRKGVQVEANDWYRTSPAVWRDYCRVAGSNTLAEWYAPLYPTTIADEVNRGTRFPEARIIGEDSVLRNRKFGLTISVERELFDDDQTGQIRQRAEVLGQSMGVTESIWAAFRFLGSARTYANITVPASAYATTDINGTAVSTPFSTTIYGSSSGNRPSTFSTLNVGRLKRAYTTSLNAVDPLSNKIVVNPDCLLVSSQDALNGKMLIEPGAYPGVPGQSDTTAAANPVIAGDTSAAGADSGVLAGHPGGAFANNPFRGMGIKLCVERYLPDWAWAFGESGKGLVFQERDPLEVVQEAPNSGNWFDFDSIRWRSRRRFIVDWVGGGSRFWYLGNDGTVTGIL